MMHLECPLHNLLNRKYRYPIGVLIGTACFTWTNISYGQARNQQDETLLPVRLRLAQFLSLNKKQPIKRAAATLHTQEIPALRLTSQLSANKTQLPKQALPLGTQGIAAPEEPVAFEAVRPGPPSKASQAVQSETDNLPDLETVIGSWAIPPIRWGGNTASSYNQNSSTGGTKTFSEAQILNLRASSYIYQPWYAQVSGDLGLLMGNSKFSSNGTDETSNNSSKTRTTSMTYGGSLSLFPLSRFPFQAYAQMGNSRADANEQGQHYTSLRMGARQSYRPEVGPENYSASADRSIVTTSNLRSIVDALQGTYSTTIADHALSANARYSRNLGDIGGQGSSLFGVSGSHSWRADEEYTVSSSANYANNQIRMFSGNGFSVNNSQVMQAGSSVTWLPDEDLPLTIMGAGNFLHINTETETAKNNLTNISGYANASYRVSNNLTAMAGLTLGQTQSNGRSQLFSGQSGTISYSGNPLIIGEFSHNWGSGIGISNQFISGGTNNSSLSAQIQHSLMRNITFSEASAIVLNASQGYSKSHNSASGQSDILTHTGGVSWQLGFGKRSLGALSATASDSLSTGSFPSHYRSFFILGNIQTQLTGRSALTASVNYVLSQQLSAPQEQPVISDPFGPPFQATTNDRNTLNGSGQVSYTHRSPFDIPNLFYSATLQMNSAQTNLRLVTGDPNALAWQTGSVFQQSIDYRVGRLMFRITNSLAKVNGKENASVYILISREIGDF